MSKIEKLIQKAFNSPQNITFEELCHLFEYYGFQVRRQGGGSSHIIYKRDEPPIGMCSLQCGKCGKAKKYQVTWLTDWIDENTDKQNNETS